MPGWARSQIDVVGAAQRPRPRLLPNPSLGRDTVKREQREVREFQRASFRRVPGVVDVASVSVAALLEAPGGFDRIFNSSRIAVGEICDDHHVLDVASRDAEVSGNSLRISSR